MRVHDGLLKAVVNGSIAATLLLGADKAAAQLDGGLAIVSDYRFRGASLSDGHPELQAHLGYDGKGGWYAGGFASGVDLKGETGGQAQLSAYAGYSRRQNSKTAWEAGAVKTIFLHAAEYDYLEGYAGFAMDNAAGRIYFSPDYFGQRARTLYAEFNGSYPLRPGLRLLGHIGLLHAFPASSGPVTNSSNRTDISLGVGAGLAQWNIRLAWTAASQHGDMPAPYGGSGSHAWVLDVTATF